MNLGSETSERRFRRKGTFAKLLSVAIAIAVLLATLYVILPRTPEKLLVNIFNRTEVDRQISLQIDGASLPSFIVRTGDLHRKPTDIDRDGIHTVMISAIGFGSRTVKTRASMNLYFELFSDGTIAYSFWDGA